MQTELSEIIALCIRKGVDPCMIAYIGYTGKIGRPTIAFRTLYDDLTRPIIKKSAREWDLTPVR